MNLYDMVAPARSLGCNFFSSRSTKSKHARGKGETNQQILINH
jgi:hypothetical protein